jgi:hypothetical protein
VKLCETAGVDPVVWTLRARFAVCWWMIGTQAVGVNAEESVVSEIENTLK